MFVAGSNEMIYTVHDVLCCGLGVIAATLFEVCYIRRIMKQCIGLSLKRILLAYIFVTISVCSIKLIIVAFFCLDFADTKLLGRLFLTCLIQGAGCGFFISLVMVLRKVDSSQKSQTGLGQRPSVDIGARNPTSEPGARRS